MNHATTGFSHPSNNSTVCKTPWVDMRTVRSSLEENIAMPVVRMDQTVLVCPVSVCVHSHVCPSHTYTAATATAKPQTVT